MHQMPNTLGLWASQPLAMSHVPRKQCCMRGAHACVSVVADDPLSRRRSCTILKDRDAPSRVSRCQLLNVGGCLQVLRCAAPCGFAKWTADGIAPVARWKGRCRGAGAARAPQDGNLVLPTGTDENDPFHTAHGHLPFALWGGAVKPLHHLCFRAVNAQDQEKEPRSAFRACAYALKEGPWMQPSSK